MSSAAERALILRLRKQVTLDDAAYIAQVELGGTYEDVLSLLIEAVTDGTLPAEKKLSIHPYSGETIGRVEPSETTVATTDLAKWLDSLCTKNTAIHQATSKSKAAVPIQSGPTLGDVSSSPEVKLDGDDEQQRPWQEIARQIADEIDRKDMSLECYDSVSHLAEKVAGELRAKKIFGRNGPVSGNTVLREALQGEKWNKHRPNRGKTRNTGNPSQKKS